MSTSHGIVSLCISLAARVELLMQYRAYASNNPQLRWYLTEQETTVC